MYGTIEVNSTHGAGSCFTIKLPQTIVREKAAPVAEAVPSEAASSGIASNSTASVFTAPDARILAVDDNRMNLLVLKGLLKRSLVQLDTASGGAECLQMAKDKKYDLILMDHMMPNPDGIATLHMLRADARSANRSTPVIVLTANAIEGMRENYLAEGFADYLSKPIVAELLEQLLAKHLPPQ